MDWRGPRAAVRLGVLSTIVAVLAFPAGAGAQVQLTDVKAEAGPDGGVRISGTVQGTDRVDSLGVRGSYQGDLTAASSHPQGNCSNFNATAQQPVLTCQYPAPGLAPGTRFVIDLRSNTPCPAGGQFLVQVQNNSSGSSAQSVVQCTQSSGADLGLTLSPTTQAFIYSELPFLTSRDPKRVISSLDGSALIVTARVTNHGLAGAEQAELVFSGPNSIPPSARAGLSEPFEQAGVVCQPGACKLGSLGPGESRVVTLRVDMVFPGLVAIRLLAFSATYDPGPRQHDALFLDSERNLPDSSLRQVADDVFRGRASAGARTTRIALVRTSGGAQVLEEETLGGGSAASCRWLRSVRVRFRLERGRRCDRPVWLRAKGRRRWRLKLRRRLPPGRYTVFSSAAGPRGAVETSFSRRDGNSRTFTVKRRRR